MLLTISSERKINENTRSYLGQNTQRLYIGDPLFPFYSYAW